MAKILYNYSYILSKNTFFLVSFLIFSFFIAYCHFLCYNYKGILRKCVLRLRSINMKDRKMSFYNRIVKRILDIICSFVAIVCLSIVYLPICIIIKCTSEGPVFFKQKRVGKNKKYFNILKFRTMRIDTPKDCPTHLLKNPEQYITKVGAFLRKTSLDELPQIFNIFKGDMSVIGPRPALWNQDDLISERDEYGINDLKPGLTGWAQINGRDELPIPEKVQMDKVYCDNISFIFDVKCLLMTVVSVFKHDGVVEGGTGAIADEE